ncbi:diguanylate cyclase [uncultured Campylobacter sp.]|uniref:diguanylate cyclase n=1 Tax=uncultured Campylobacter sp. TaxID=218934 RepID=UPI0026036A18|nr:diguanylate cyclase [uncultured Campylobacter sp.]
MDDKDLLSDFGRSNDVGGFGEGQKLQKISGGELEKFSRSVIDQLIKDNVPPIPENYKIYFIKLLHEQSTMTFRKKISEMMNFEDVEDSKQVFIEKTVKKAFAELSLLMQDIAMVYKNTGVMEGVLQKKMSELSINSSELSIKNILSDLSVDIERFDSVLKKYSYDIKAHFENILDSCKSIEQKSDFDPTYETYNKKFLLDLIEKSKDGYAKYNYQNSLILFKIKDALLNNISEQKDRLILQKNITKTLSKLLDSGDVMAYYDNGIFAIVLRHTNMQNAQKKAETLLESAYNTTFFLGGSEIDMNLEMAVGMIKDDANTDKFIERLIRAMAKTSKDKENFAIVD